jgi:two-component system sensor histidine kinase AlgZ
VHPIFSDGRRLAIYTTTCVPLAVAGTALLTRAPNALDTVGAAGIALPLSAVALGLMLPVWYLCRALPPESSPWSRLLVTHGGGAALASAALVYVGSGLARFVASWRADAPLPALYQSHATAVFAGGVLLYLLAVSFHYTLLALDATRRAEQQSTELRVLARESELRALKAQVHPHFLFNSLNSISALTATDPARAREMCILLAEFFRKSLSVGEKDQIALEEELAVTRAYLAIEGLRMGSRLVVHESVDEASRKCQVPPLLLQPLVENAVRHGVATCAEGGTLQLQALCDGERLSVRIENPYDPESPARPGVGLGLKNVRQRLLARYGDRAAVDAQRSGDLFRVVLLLPAEVPL